MITLRPAAARGHARHGWLDSHHTFSFADYHDPAHMGFGVLRVINEDRVEPGEGFGKHPHRDMEIVTWVLEGAVEHKDSLGNGEVLRPGEVQRMSAGTGILHSEFNPSKTEPVHFLQIWILPKRRGIAPTYEQRSFAEAIDGKLALVASGDGRDGALAINQDLDLWIGRLGAGGRAELAPAAGRLQWVQVARGAVTVNGVALAEGDGAAIEGESRLDIVADDAAEVLVFDMTGD